MKFLAFQKQFSGFPLVSVSEVEKSFPAFDHNVLTRWQRAGYLEKIRNNQYRFTNRPISGEDELFFIANRIYNPSYVSLQSALSWHGFIPEGVFTVTNVTTLKTQTFNTSAGTFAYRTVKPELFFGYQLITFGAFRFKIATPAKALLDLLYFFPNLDSEDHFFELRLNFWELKEKFDPIIFEQYLSVFNSRALENRATTLLKFLQANDVTR
jgi:predicted transcriptional regulator of viral defense system